jgi:hypothetical protein
MIEDFYQGNFNKGPDQVMEEAPEPTAKAYYDMLSSAQKPLHEHTDVSQLDAQHREWCTGALNQPLPCA